MDEQTEKSALRESEEMYHNLIERSNDGVAVLQDRLIKLVNPRFIEMSGYSADELIDTPFVDYLTPEEIAFLYVRYQKRMAGEPVPPIYEMVMTRKDGSKIPLEISAAIVPFQGRPADLVLFRDLTERKRAEASLDAERRRLRSVLDALPLAVVIADAEGRLVEANEQADVIWGGPVPHVESMERYCEFKGWWADTGEPIAPHDWAMARALTKGETSMGEMIHIQRFDGQHATILHSAAPIRDAEGKIIGGVVALQDITELVHLREALERSLEEARREGQRAAALESIAEADLSILRPPDLLDALVERIAGAFGVDSCCVFVLDEEAGEFEAHAAYNIPGLLGCRVRADEGLLGKVARDREPVYVGDAEHDPLAYDSCEVRTMAKTLLGVPLIARGRVVGVTRVQSLVAREFSEEEVNLLQAIADRVAMAIDNAKLYDDLQRSRRDAEQNLEQERRFSMLLQRALLPAEPSVGEGYNVAVRYVPAFAGQEVGGDFYDVFQVADGWCGILIGDVSGKGLEAAALAATTRSTVHAFVHENPSAGEALTRANSVLYAQQPNMESYVTVFLVTLNLSTGEACHSSAGHPPAAMLRSDGSVEFLPLANLPLGVLDVSSHEQFHNRLEPGDKLLLYTDGITDSHSQSRLFDLEGIERTLVGHSDWTVEEVADRLIAAATEWADGKLRDDTAVVVVERWPSRSPLCRQL